MFLVAAEPGSVEPAVIVAVPIVKVELRVWELPVIGKEAETEAVVVTATKLKAANWPL